MVKNAKPIFMWSHFFGRSEGRNQSQPQELHEKKELFFFYLPS
jgi:hypothetical protein